jgi:hypothetical protein
MKEKNIFNYTEFQIIEAIFASPQTPLLVAEGLCEEHHLKNTSLLCGSYNCPHYNY